MVLWHLASRNCWTAALLKWRKLWFGWMVLNYAYSGVGVKECLCELFKWVGVVIVFGYVIVDIMTAQLLLHHGSFVYLVLRELFESLIWGSLCVIRAKLTTTKAATLVILSHAWSQHRTITLNVELNIWHLTPRMPRYIYSGQVYWIPVTHFVK